MLKNLAFEPFTSKELKPEGWMLKQLKVQADGLSGNLDKFWPDIKDSKWIGGSCEGWERVPYWLDGFIPLAYLLEDSDMISRANKYIDAILSRQNEDGWICPCETGERGSYDIWAYYLILKVLVVHYECSGDERIERAVYNALRLMNRHIDSFTVFNWASSRWFEALIPIYWLYDRVHEDWLIELAIKLKVQGIDYKTLYQSFIYKQKRKDAWSQLNHVVNQAMAVKSFALFGRIAGDSADARYADTMLDILDKYHGTVTGIFTGDENLAGRSPIQGTELCAVVELMYSIEHLLQIEGGTKWADKLEYIGFNALPATLSPDMWTHQYDQMVNQIQCTKIPDEHVHFSTNSGVAHLYGLEPNFGCCTANFNQAFPKFMLSSFMKTDNGIASVLLLPSVLNTNIGGNDIEIKLTTQYPFKNSIEYTVNAATPVEFELMIRIPMFAASATVNGIKATPGEFYKINRKWMGVDKITVELEFETTIIERDNGLKSVRRGPLLYSIAIGEDWQPTDDKGNREILPKTSYNYALDSADIRIIEHDIGSYVFDNESPPIEAYAFGYKIDWKQENGILYEKPESLEPLSGTEEIKLLPYGCTNLRVTEFPIQHRSK